MGRPTSGVGPFIFIGMIQMTIEGEVYEIPSQLTVEQWAAAIKFDLGEEAYWPHIINAVTGAPIHLFKNVDKEGQELAVIFIATTMQQREPVEMMQLDEMKFGEWVDLDVYAAFGIDKHFKDILDIIAPEATTAAQGLWALDKYSRFKKFILNQYKELFGIEGNIEDIDADEYEMDPMQVAKQWYKLIIGLAKDDLLKLDEVTEQPLKKVLNFMAHEKEEALKEQERQRQQRLKYDLQRTR